MFQSNWNAVSNLIGIILMVAVTVAMIGLAGTIVFNLSSDTSEPASVSVGTTVVEDNEQTTVRAKIVQNQNAERIFLRYPVKSSGTEGDGGNADCTGIEAIFLGLVGECENSEDDSDTKSDDTEIKNVTKKDGGTGIDLVEIRSDENGDTKVQSGAVQIVAVVDDDSQVIKTIYY